MKRRRRGRRDRGAAELFDLAGKGLRVLAELGELGCVDLHRDRHCAERDRQRRRETQLTQRPPRRAA
ncbi:hypothetical protein GCM10027294_25760 [Marinactinospora endophytica]